MTDEEQDIAEDTPSGFRLFRVQLIVAVGPALKSGGGTYEGVNEMMSGLLGANEPLTGGMTSSQKGQRAAKIWLSVGPMIVDDLERDAIRRALYRGREADFLNMLRAVQHSEIVDYTALGAISVWRPVTPV